MFSGLIFGIGICTIILIFAATMLNENTLHSAVATLIVDIRQQQEKSLLGEVEGKNAVTPFGIVFKENGYLLFQGLFYSPSENDQARVSTIAPNLSLESTLPKNSLIFESGTGNILNYDASKNTITITDTVTGAQQTLAFNLYGVISLAQ